MTEAASAPAVAVATQPTASQATPQASVTAPTPSKAPEIDAAALQKKLDLKVREGIAVRRSLESTVKKTQAERDAAAAKLAEFERREAAAKRNPVSYLQSLYGENWYETVVSAKVNGVAPADLVAESIEQVEKKFEAKLAEREAAAKAEASKMQEAAIRHARADLQREAQEFYASAADKYPIFKGLGGEQAIAQLLAQRIETEYNRTEKRSEDGVLLRQGRLISVEEAADGLEKEILGILSLATKSDKYKTYLTPQEAQATVSVKNQLQQGQQHQQQQSQARQTLSNKITGSTSTKAPPLSESERRERAMAAFNAARRK